MTLHFLNDVANDAESTQKSKNYVIIVSLKSDSVGKLINRIPGSSLLISSLPGSALRTHVESLGKRCQHAFSKPCLVNLISKDANLVFSLYKLQNVKRIKTKTGSLCYSSCAEVLS